MSRIRFFSGFLSFYFLFSPVSFASSNLGAEHDEYVQKVRKFFEENIPEKGALSFAGQPLTSADLENFPLLFSRSNFGELDLGGCSEIGDRGGQVVSDVIRTMENLTILNMKNTGITTAGCNSLYDGLLNKMQGEDPFQELDIRGNNLKDSEVARIVSLMEEYHPEMSVFVEIKPSTSFAVLETLRKTSEE